MENRTLIVLICLLTVVVLVALGSAIKNLAKKCDNSTSLKALTRRISSVEIAITDISSGVNAVYEKLDTKSELTKKTITAHTTISSSLDVSEEDVKLYLAENMLQEIAKCITVNPVVYDTFEGTKVYTGKLNIYEEEP